MSEDMITSADAGKQGLDENRKTHYPRCSEDRRSGAFGPHRRAIELEIIDSDAQVTFLHTAVP